MTDGERRLAEQVAAVAVGVLDADCEEVADDVPDCGSELDCADDVDWDGDAVDVCADPPVVSLAQPTATASTAAAVIHFMFPITDDHTSGISTEHGPGDRQIGSLW